MDDFYKYFPIGIFIVQLLMGWLFWSLKREFVSQKYCDGCQNQLAESVNQLKARTQRTEDNLQSLPNSQSIHSLSLQLEKMAGNIHTLTEILERVEQKVMRQEDFLLNNGGK